MRLIFVLLFVVLGTHAFAGTIYRDATLEINHKTLQIELTNENCKIAFDEHAIGSGLWWMFKCIVNSSVETAPLLDQGYRVNSNIEKFKFAGFDTYGIPHDSGSNILVTLKVDKAQFKSSSEAANAFKSGFSQGQISVRINLVKISCKVNGEETDPDSDVCAKLLRF